MPPAAATVADKKPNPRRSAPAEVTRRSPLDRALGLCGVLIACASAVFAAYMTANSDHPPEIAGLEYLAIFARPSHPLVAAAQPKAPPPAPTALASRSIDPTPTGSIRERSGPGRPLDLVPAPAGDVDPNGGYKVLDVVNGEALIESEAGLRRVRVGDVLPRLGRIDAIENQGDRWVLMTQNGAALESRPTPPTAAGPAGPRTKASKP